MLAVGEHEFGAVDEQMLRMTTGFSGGVGSTRGELCGALSAGVMLIGARHGRSRADADDRLCRELAARYRSRFIETFGVTCCQELRERHPSCVVLVEQATAVLLDTLDTP